MAKRRFIGQIDEASWQDLKDLISKREDNYNALQQVRDITGRGLTTLRNVKLSKSFEDYKKIATEQTNYYNNQRKGFVLEAKFPDSYMKSLKEKKETKEVKENSNHKPRPLTRDRLEVLIYNTNTIISLMERLVEQTKPQKRWFDFLK